MAKFNHTHEPATRWKTPLPPERLADVGFVFDGQRVICPWPRGGGLTLGQEHQLLAVLARIDVLQPERVVWLWPDDREPVPVQADDPTAWLRRWAADRASYVTRQASRAGR